MRTRRPLSTGIFSATLLLQKNVWRRRGSNSQPTGWETRKHFKHQSGFEPTTWLGKWTHHGTEIKWFWQNDFPPPFMWAKNNNFTHHNSRGLAFNFIANFDPESFGCFIRSTVIKCGGNVQNPRRTRLS